MDAKDRIPLLERELLRIQNELSAARADRLRDIGWKQGALDTIREAVRLVAVTEPVDRHSERILGALADGLKSWFEGKTGG